MTRQSDEASAVRAVLWDLHGTLIQPVRGGPRLSAPDFVRRTLPTRGVERVLAEIPMRTHRFGLVTSASRAVAEGVLERFGWRWRFEVVVSADDVTQQKPDPEAYLLACEQLGLSPTQVLVIEDSLGGIQAGLAAGCRVAALPTTRRPEELAAASFLLSNVGALPALLGVLS